METKANHLIVGSFVLILAAGLLFFIVWIAKFQVAATFTRYDIFFDGSVTGLVEGSAVRYSGVKVGEVVFIGLDRQNPNQVRAMIEVEAETPIRTDTVASLELEGLAGGRYVLLRGGSPEAPPLEVAEGQKRPRIPSARSSLEQVLQGAPEVLANVNALLVQANSFLNDSNRENLSRTLENLRSVSDAIAARETEIGKLIDDAGLTLASVRSAGASFEGMMAEIGESAPALIASAERTLASLETLSSALEETVGKDDGDVKLLIADIRKSASSFTQTSDTLRKLIRENAGPIDDFAKTGVYEFIAVLTEARELILNLNRLTIEVQRDPARFFFGDQQEGYETQQ